MPTLHIFFIFFTSDSQPNNLASSLTKSINSSAKLSYETSLLFPKSTKLVCINGSHEEIELNRAADINLLCDPGVFLDTLKNLKKNNKWNLSNEWFDFNRTKKQEWVDKTLKDLKKETKEAEVNGDKMHPLQLALDVQDAIG